MEEPSVGERLGRYELQRELGRGAMGLVFLAEDTVLRQAVCLKILHPAVAENAEAVARFTREIVLARRVAHRSVCRLHDLHEEAGVHFISMEYVDGTQLRDLIAREGSGPRRFPIPIERTLRIIRRLCEGLDAAHSVGVLHRDLKPANIMLRRFSSDDDVVILDFGIAIADGDASKLTRPGFALGTRHYIAPEVWAGQAATQRSDLFAVGVILFQLLTGRLPWAAATDLQLVNEMGRGPAPSPSSLRPGVSFAIDAIVKNALAVEPSARAFDARRFAAACAAACPSTDVVAVDAPRPVTGLSPMRFNMPAVPTPLPAAQAASTRSAMLAPEPFSVTQWVPPAILANAPPLPPDASEQATGAPVVVDGGHPSAARVILGRLRASTTRAVREDMLRRPPAAAVVLVAVIVLLALWASHRASRGQRQAENDVDAGGAAVPAVVDVVVVEEAPGEPAAPPPPAPGRRSRGRWLDAQIDLNLALDRKGLIAADDDGLDRLLGRATTEARALRFDAATLAAREALLRTEEIHVDRAFVQRKLARFDARFDVVTDAQRRTTLHKMKQGVLAALQAGRLDAANRALNEAFARLP
ncbi:MAG: protein kinase [Deltaproteobacteria bacterium]|nr:protein kinase [Deltaproteobacteria bacterium]